ncbi:MAG: homocysteine S-methyltransferase family protein, partial [Herbinix sp.]|nr:homocysteine S-methyltransferase family protein [Herbinix sp.]
MNKNEFIELIESKIVILDGACGSNLQKRGMLSGICPEQWMTDYADIVIDLQRQFLEAGTDIIFAPTFTSNRI